MWGEALEKPLEKKPEWLPFTGKAEDSRFKSPWPGIGGSGLARSLSGSALFRMGAKRGVETVGGCGLMISIQACSCPWPKRSWQHAMGEGKLRRGSPPPMKVETWPA